MTSNQMAGMQMVRLCGRRRFILQDIFEYSDIEEEDNDDADEDTECEESDEEF